jgi:hypothetical protein
MTKGKPIIFTLRIKYKRLGRLTYRHIHIYMYISGLKKETIHNTIARGEKKDYQKTMLTYICVWVY